MKQNVYFIADTHFSHKNIIPYEPRPFQTIEEMDEYMIERWNSVVSDHDLVFHLGDVTFGGADRAKEVLTRLKGRKILILGNHDHFTKTKWRNLGFQPHSHYFYKDYVLTHIPAHEQPLRIAMQEGLLKGNIHGHTHSQNGHLPKDCYTCCSVELIDYTPISLDELIRRQAEQRA